MISLAICIQNKSVTDGQKDREMDTGRRLLLPLRMHSIFGASSHDNTKSTLEKWPVVRDNLSVLDFNAGDE